MRMKKKDDYPMLLATINRSISNENKHLTLKGLLELINDFEKIKNNLSNPRICYKYDSNRSL